MAEKPQVAEKGWLELKKLYGQTDRPKGWPKDRLIDVGDDEPAKSCSALTEQWNYDESSESKR